VEFSAGYIPEETLDLFFNQIEKEIIEHYFTYSSESNLLRIITGMFDKTTFLNECIKYPHYIEILILVSVNSNYLTDILVRNPEYFYFIANPANLEQMTTPVELRDEIRNSISKYNSFNAKVNAFRIIKRREILRIGLTDLMKTRGFKEITFELSILAKIIIEGLFELCYLEILKKYKIEIPENKYCIVALGKLGGDELNYSSDVDLIIFYDDNTKINNREFHEILTEAIHFFIENSTSLTSSGYIYRVDLRLRPDGRNSPLCRSLNDYLIYYESKGEDWERQMLLKASFAGGSRELFDGFIKYLQPFIYPLSFSISPTEQIFKLKSDIEKNLRNDENIKLAPGGIRDIEFSVQALQLINGGRYKEIRTGNTLEAIELLDRKKLLTKEEALTFKQAYLIYRYSEHFLQLMNDKQTHLIPESGELLEKLSFFLRYSSAAEFNKEIALKRSQVKKIFSSIMDKKESREDSKIERIKFENRRKAENDLLFLSEGKGVLGIRQFDTSSIELFQKIEPDLVKYLEASTRPDSILQNFARIIKNIPFPSLWYREFTDKKFFYFFLRLCELSQKTVDLFAEDEELHEYFISRKVFERIDIATSARFSIKKLLFILSAQFTLGIINSNKFGEILQKNIIEKIKETGMEIIPPGSEYFIAGLGSFGAGEMNFSSDIDLLFIVKDQSLQFELQKFFQNLLVKLKKSLKPFETDCRLRPEGKSGQLVWDLISYERYLGSRARVWELQSLCKLKFVSGDKHLFNKFKRLVIERISKEDSEHIRKEIKVMRKNLVPSGAMNQMKIINLKRGSGGILDIEFTIQYLMLANHELFKLLLNASSDKRILKLLPEEKNIKENYIFLKDMVLRNQCIFSSSGYLFKENEKENVLYQKELSSILQVNNKLFNKTMGK
jgi:glutamate-ammonia-ligase adenylyltransferase